MTCETEIIKQSWYINISIELSKDVFSFKAHHVNRSYCQRF